MSIIIYYNGTDLKHQEFDMEVYNNFDQLVKHGHHVKYWRNQQKAAEGTLIVGKRHGVWNFWYDSGIPESMNTYANGALSGNCVRYHTNGLTAASGNFSNDLQVGLWENWYINGQMESRGQYKDGHRNGEWHFWDDKGTPIGIENYDI